MINLLPPMLSKLKRLLAPYPALFVPMYHLFSSSQKNRELLISAQTEIVIEGFPRCGNTFAVVAFEFAQSRKVSIAHHLHVESQALMGVRRGLPVMIAIRDPEEAIRSLVVFDPKTVPNQALADYIRFYTAIERIFDAVLIADFKQITTNYGEVIRRFNCKFAVKFAVFQHTPENTAKVFALIDDINRKVGLGEEAQVARPSETRRKLLSAVSLNNLPSSLLREARDLHFRLTQPMP